MSAQIFQDSNALSDAILPDGGFRKQAALRALAAAISATRRYLAEPFISSADDFVAQAEIAEKWAHAASYLVGVGEWSLARQCFGPVRRWQQENFDVNSSSKLIADILCGHVLRG